mgnify:CR=1 FL=1
MQEISGRARRLALVALLVQGGFTAGRGESAGGVTGRVVDRAGGPVPGAWVLRPRPLVPGPVGSSVPGALPAAAGGSSPSPTDSLSAQQMAP